MNLKMNKEHIAQLREAFEVAYPDYATKLKKAYAEGAAKNEYSAYKMAYEEILQDAKDKAKPFLTDEENVAGCPPIALTPGQYASMIKANGDSIQVQITAILKTAQIVQTDWSNEQAAAQFIVGGLTGITKQGIDAFGKDIKENLKMLEAVIAGIKAVGVPGIVAVVALIIVAIIVPILYFMLKPASCFVALLNETEDSLKWVGDVNIHGKPVVRTEEIPRSLLIGEDRYVACGMIQTDKKDGALFGTQYGFTYNSVHGNASFGVECPLTSIYVDNNCYCAIDSTAESVATITDEKNVLSSSASKPDPNMDISIKCNSPSGYVAYYVARVEDGSL